MMPSPLHASHLPPLTLKLNLPFSNPLILDSGRFAKRSRMCVNMPVYVAGLERGVRPIGDWSMSITLSMFSRPRISSNLPASSLVLLVILDAPLHNISLIRLLLPEPETPVTQTNLPSGISTSMCFRLFSAAPLIIMDLPLPGLRTSGTCICFLPDRY